MHNPMGHETWFNGNTPCHNDHGKKICDNCSNCGDSHCNQSECDRIGRCMCDRTQCVCLGRNT